MGFRQIARPWCPIHDYRHVPCRSVAIVSPARPNHEVTNLQVVCSASAARDAHFLVELFDENESALRGYEGVASDLSGSLGGGDRAQHVGALLIGGLAESGGLSEQAGGFPGQDASEEGNQQVGKFYLEKSTKPVWSRALLLFCNAGGLVFGIYLISTCRRGWRYRLGVTLCFAGPLALLFGWNLT